MVKTAWAGRGGGGSGKLNCERGFAVDAIEYTGDPGTGGSCEGVGDAGRECCSEAMFFCVLFVYLRARRPLDDDGGRALTEARSIARN